MTYLWIAAIVLFAVIELLTYQLVSIWFVGGSIAGLIAQLCGGDLWVQVIAFTVVSAALLVLTRPAVKKIQGKKINTNIDELIGKDAIVTRDINNIQGEGEAKVNGNTWTARSVDGSEIPEGKIVKVKKIEGVKLIVE